MRILSALLLAGAAGCWVTTDGLSAGASARSSGGSNEGMESSSSTSSTSGSSGSASSSSASSSGASSSSASSSSASSSGESDGGSSGDAGPTRRVAFVTSTRLAGGELGGLAGADATCGAHGRLLTGHSRFKAWLSDSTHDAIDRIVDVGPWYASDRTTILFASKSALQAIPSNGILLDEAGRSNTTAGNWGYYWTGTSLGGIKSASNCGDWTNASTTARGTIGEETLTTPAWTSTGTSACDPGWVRRLFCLEQ